MGRIRMTGQQRVAAGLAVALVVGVALVAVGCWMWWPPAGLIAPGVVLLVVAFVGFFGVDVEGERR